MTDNNLNKSPAEINENDNIKKTKERDEADAERMKTCRGCGEDAHYAAWRPGICEDCFDNYNEETGEYNPNAL